MEPGSIRKRSPAHWHGRSRLAVRLRFASHWKFLSKTNRSLKTMKAATGSFGIVFPAGGTLDGEVSKRLSEAFAQGQVPWGLYSGSFPFTAATIDGTIKPGTVALMLDGEAVGSRIGGSLHIAVPSGQVSGTLVMRPTKERGKCRRCPARRRIPPVSGFPARRRP